MFFHTYPEELYEEGAKTVSELIEDLVEVQRNIILVNAIFTQCERICQLRMQIEDSQLIQSSRDHPEEALRHRSSRGAATRKTPLYNARLRTALDGCSGVEKEWERELDIQEKVNTKKPKAKAKDNNRGGERPKPNE